jgi:hypothetical protein
MDTEDSPQAFKDTDDKSNAGTGKRPTSPQPEPNLAPQRRKAMQRWLRKLSSNKRTAPLFVTCVQLPDGRQIPEEFREKDVTGLEHLLLLKK